MCEQGIAFREIDCLFYQRPLCQQRQVNGLRRQTISGDWAWVVSSQSKRNFSS